MIGWPIGEPRTDAELVACTWQGYPMPRGWRGARRGVKKLGLVEAHCERTEPHGSQGRCSRGPVRDAGHLGLGSP